MRSFSHIYVENSATEKLLITGLSVAVEKHFKVYGHLSYNNISFKPIPKKDITKFIASF